MISLAQGDSSGSEAGQVSLGKYVVAQRKLQGLSQGELARRLGDLGWTQMRQAIVSRIELGQRPVRLHEGPLLALALEVPLDSLVSASGFKHHKARRIEEARGNLRVAQREHDEAARRVDEAEDEIARVIGAFRGDSDG